MTMGPQFVSILFTLALMPLAWAANGGANSNTLHLNDTCTESSIPTQIPKRQCPPCIMKQGGCSCAADWSTSSLECVTNPQASVITGYSSGPIYDDNGKITIKGTSISTNSFKTGWACYDGVGGYYSGGFCYAAHGAVCNCKDGHVWTNAATCLPLVCDPISTPDRCTCTLDNSC